MSFPNLITTLLKQIEQYGLHFGILKAKIKLITENTTLIVSDTVISHTNMSSSDTYFYMRMKYAPNAIITLLCKM